MLNTLNNIENVIRMLYENTIFREYYRFGDNKDDFNILVEKHFEDIKKLILSVKDY